ncbi:uncharacterized protein BDW43DRAFT_296655 [Aspergillus alliaceus]|uniref:uncharacterized protein n=1 Tax=Petromyces alliaceus TaxID=209559 RepID=UPI0012A6C882|nr:uncharacterized protein BDW43DRAFT_296655 [Aspergillus alliaceus]KAB8238378.1 hypothetical protein BDW43DRAFT_296655 [Aspergillus alliaceus]
MESSDNPRRRNRRIHSCLACRQRKLRCNRQQPCSNCSRSDRECIFLRLDSEHQVRKKLATFKEQSALLAKSLEQDVVIATPAKMTSGSLEESEDDLLITSFDLALLGIQDATYDHEEDDGSDDDRYDLGFRFGKMRMNERVGGFFHPHMADELSAFLDETTGTGTPRAPNLDNLSVAEKDLYFGPGPSFIPPQSGFLFSPSCSTPISDWFPPRDMADTLMQQYWEAVHPVVRIVHRPSIEWRHRAFWEAIDTGARPSAALRALTLAMFFTAVVSMPMHQVLHQFGIPQQVLQKRLQFHTENALKGAKLLSTTRLETLQAFVLYLIPMCRSEISRAHSALVGMAVRLAESMGLHRDPGGSQYSAIESHVRRLVWYQVCFLDLRTSEVQGPRVAIRPGDFSVELPLNLDDNQIMDKEQGGSRMWTEMTYTRIRFECQEMQRKCLLLRIQLEQKKLPLSQVLKQIESFRQHMESQYNPILSQTNLTPLQSAAKHLMTLLISRLYTAVLHQLYRSLVREPPVRLRQLVVTTGIQQLESSMALETIPQLQPWSWYSQAYHQYHVSMLLLLEVYLRPTGSEADRIWSCLEYVYTTTSPASEDHDDLGSRRRKARSLLTALRDHLDIYCRIRRARVPAQSRGSSHVDIKRSPSTVPDRKSPLGDAVATWGICRSIFDGPTIADRLATDGSLAGPTESLPRAPFVDYGWAEWDTLHRNILDGTF